MKKLLISVPCFALALLAVACNGKAPQGAEAPAAPVKEAQRLVKVEQVYAREVPQVYEFTASVESNIKNNIAPMMAVRIKQLYVEVGDRVRAGQKLAQMDNNNLHQAKTQLDNLELSFRRIDELYKIGGVSKADWDAQSTALEVARTSYNNLVENTQLLSPINGVVTARNYDEGDLYNMAMPVYVVEQISPVKLVVNVSEMLYTKITKGMGVDITLDVYPGEHYEGKVSLVYPTIEPSTRTFKVELTIANVNGRVKPGMFARARFNLGSENRVVVPDLAVIKQQGSGDRFVYVFTPGSGREGTVAYTKIALGQRLDNAYELLSGVPDGAQVVVAGHSRLSDGVTATLAE